MERSLLHIVNSNDSTPIACKVSGTGPPLVLVHGSASVGDRWAAVTPLFTQHFTVYAMDRRGRGASGDSKDYSIEREFEDIACVLASIDGQVNLLGHSFGGVCSMEAALRASNLRRLIVYEPSTPTPGVQHYPTGFVDRLQEFLEQGQQEDVLLTSCARLFKCRRLSLIRSNDRSPGRVGLLRLILCRVSFETSKTIVQIRFDSRRSIYQHYCYWVATVLHATEQQSNSCLR